MIRQFLIAGAAVSILATSAQAQMHGHGHGADGTGHDMVNMPGLRGVDTTPDEVAEMATMFRNFPLIVRSVENLPNGIQTVTFSESPEVMDAIVNHAVGMIDRVGQKRDPKVMIQSPTLDIFFERSERLRTEIDITDKGLVVTQTTDDPELVAALHKHAAEVSDMAARGMQAVHEMMVERHHGSGG